MKPKSNQNQTMKNILAVTLIATGLEISIMSFPASAIPEKQRIEQSIERRGEIQNKPVKNEKQASPDTSGSTSLGPLFDNFSMGLGTISTDGIIQYGFEFTYRFENIKMQTGTYLGGDGSAYDGRFIVGMAHGSMLNPFIGAGLGNKSVKKNQATYNPNNPTPEFSFYGTAGVELNLGTMNITTAIDLPTNSAYGTQYRVSIGSSF
jgi:opacity protein-like surface antigen